jgi:hypothetical protein
MTKIEPLEQEMISRYLDMRKRVVTLYEEAEKLHEDASALAYGTAIQFPDFIDHVCEQSGPTKLTAFGLGIGDEERLTPADLLREMLTVRSQSCSARPDELPRKPNESARHWMQRLEKDMKSKDAETDRQRREAAEKPWRVRIFPKTGDPYYEDRRFATAEEAKMAGLEIANAKTRKKLNNIEIRCHGTTEFNINWDRLPAPSHSQ